MSETIQDNSSRQDEVKAKRKRLVITSIIIVVIIIVILLLLRGCGGISGNNDVKTGSITITHDEPMPAQNFIVFVNSNIYIREGTANLLAQNNKDNLNDCFVTLELENGTVLYKTDVMSPGEYVDSVGIDSDLNPGTHNAIAVFHVLSDSGEEITSISIKLTITVE